MIARLIEKEWDVIVIGAGLGGGSIGRRMAERGLSVLFVEQGPFGPRAEQHGVHGELFDREARRVRGFETKPFRATINGRTSVFYSLLGAGVGGSSAFYAATLERPERHDIDDSAERPHPTGGWAASFDEFIPYFEEAERLYDVCGEEDPLSREAPSTLRKPPELNERDALLRSVLLKDGLHPYHVHLGIRFLPDCQKCIGKKCPKRCKMDGRSAGVEPALETGNAAVLDLTEVVGFRGTRDQISHIEAIRDKERITLKAKQYVLAGGAIGSARLLLSSVSDAWPNGCANSSDLVGRNLMLHLSEFVAAWTKGKTVKGGPTKTLSLRDVYYDQGARYGAFGDMGIDASYGEIYHFLRDRFDRSALKDFRALRELLRIPAFIGAKIFGDAKILVGQMEDLPYAENRVVWDPTDSDHIHLHYEVKDELRERRKKYRQLLRRKMPGLRLHFLNYEADLNFPHNCGTLKFGDDAKTSVLDRNCRAHDIDNLYVADASFMPTSTGINPGLTIIANALRVGDIICDRFSE